MIPGWLWQELASENEAAFLALKVWNQLEDWEWEDTHITEVEYADGYLRAGGAVVPVPPMPTRGFAMLAATYFARNNLRVDISQIERVLP